MEKRVSGGRWKNGIKVCHLKTDVGAPELSLLKRLERTY